MGRHSHFIQGAAAREFLLSCASLGLSGGSAGSGAGAYREKTRKRSYYSEPVVKNTLKQTGSRVLTFLRWSLFAKVGVEDSVIYASALAEALNIFWGIT